MVFPTFTLPVILEEEPILLFVYFFIILTSLTRKKNNSYQYVIWSQNCYNVFKNRFKESLKTK